MLKITIFNRYSKIIVEIPKIMLLLLIYYNIIDTYYYNLVPL